MTRNAVQRCALPGCNALIQPTEGRPPRKYCSAAHRAASRRLHRAETAELTLEPTHGKNGELIQDVDPSEVGPVVGDAAEPTELPAPRLASRAGARRRPVPWEPVSSPAASRARAAAAETVAQERRRRQTAAQRRKRRAVAVLSAAGILAGGGGWVAVSSSPSSPTPTPTGAGPGEVVPDEAARWASQAEVVLASVSQQLDVVAQAQETWNKRPESRRASTPPAPVAEMLQRKALLEQQRATLQSQLAAWHSLGQVEGELSTADQQLGAIEKVLQSMPDAEKLTAEQASSVKQLADQRDIRVKQRDAKKQELESLQTGVRNAIVTPLQDTADKTKELADTVLGLVSGQEPKTPNPPNHEPLPAVANRDNPNRQRQDTNNSAPPDPRGPRAGASPNPGHVVEGAVGAVGEVAGAVGSLLPGGGNKREKKSDNKSDADKAENGSGSSADQSKAGKPAKAPTVERQNKDSRGSAPAGGRLSSVAGDVLDAAGALLPGRDNHGRADRSVDAPGAGARAADSQATDAQPTEAQAAEAQAPDAQAADTHPAETRQAGGQDAAAQDAAAQDDTAQAAHEGRVARTRAPHTGADHTGADHTAGSGGQAVDKAAAQQEQPASERAPAHGGSASAADAEPVVPAPRARTRHAPSDQQTADAKDRQAAVEIAKQVMSRWTPDRGSAADDASQQHSRKVTVDQLVDYAWQRAMEDAQRRMAAEAETPAPRSSPADAEQLPADYQDMVSAWSNGH